MLEHLRQKIESFKELDLSKEEILKSLEDFLQELVSNSQ
jgi:DNA-binding transcriptional regulator YhcF (GntR family)